MQIVTTHKNTDFDGFASVIAAALIYPQSVAVLPKALNPNVRAFLSLHKDLFQVCTPNEVDFDSVRSLVVVDTASWCRLEGFDALKGRPGLETIVWDHHAPDGDIPATCFFQEPMGAAVTLIVRALKASATAISPIQATLFLMGIYEDRGSLTFPGTRPEDAFAAGHLMVCQASVRIVDLMSFPVSRVDPGTPMAQVADLLRTKGHSGLPVVDEQDRVVGILSRRDFRKIRKKSKLQAPAKAFMQSSVKTIEAGSNPQQAARLMIRHDIGRLPVMEDGRMVGIVTRSDVMRYYYDMLPE